MIELRAVTKSFDDDCVIDAMDLVVPAGSTTVLIGPSGCGKSTVLRLMLGLLWPDSGEVLLDGARVGSTPLDLLRHRVGYVIQDGGLFPHLTARANVCLMAGRLGWTPSRAKARLDELVRLTRFPRDGLDRLPAELSGGQRQRVALMRALMLDPDVLLLDEPLGALDPLVRHELQSDLREIFDELARTVVLVTHDLAEAGFFGKRIVLMRDGRIVQQGAIAALIEQPADPFVSRFVTAQRPPIAWEPPA